MVGSFLGRSSTLSAEAYIELNGVKFPVPENTEEGEIYGGDIVSSALEPFAPSVVAGDAAIVEENRVAILGWGDWRTGGGYAESDEQDSLSGFAYGTLDTRYANMAVLPPEQVDMGVLDPALLAGFGLRFIATTLAPDGVLGFAKRTHGHIYEWNGTTAWTLTALPAAHNIIYDLFEFANAALPNGILVALTDAGVTTATGGPIAWTDRWMVAGGFMGGCVHDGKVFALNTGDRKIYWETDPTLAVAWGSSSTEAIELGNGETVLEVFTAKLSSGARAVHVLTSRKIVAYDDSDDAWVDVYIPQIDNWDSDESSAIEWIQDRAIYHSFADLAGSAVVTVTPDTVQDISPNKNGGYPLSQRRKIIRLAGGLRYVYALARTAQQEFYYGDGTAPVAVPVPGWVMAWNGAGWHTLVEGADSSTKYLRSLSYIKNQIIFTRMEGADHRVYTCYLPEFGSLPYDTDHRTYQEGSFYIVSAETDAELADTDKTARYAALRIETQARVPGLPTGHEAEFWVSWDGAAFAQIGPTLTSASTFPARIPLPYPTQEGKVWNRLSWKLVLRKNAGADKHVTPVLRGVAIAYTRSPDIYDGIQMEIDLSRDRFAGPNRREFYGRTRAELHSLLNAYRVAGGIKTHVAVAWGDGETRRTVAAAEIRINAIENPATGYGRYQITARDVSVPASG